MGFPSLLALGINGIVGVGIFFIPDDVATLVPGPVGALVYITTAIALLPVAAVYALLGGRFPEDGGPQVWAQAAFGSAAAFVVGWIAYVSAVFSSAAIIAGLTEPIARALTLSSVSQERLTALICITILSWVAFSGLRLSAHTWTTLTVLKLLPLLILVGLGAHGIMVTPLAGSTVTDTSGSFVRAMLIVVFALQGFEIVAVPAGHARGGRRAIPAATIGSLMIAAVLYSAIHRVSVTAVPNLADMPQPLTAAAEALGGQFAGALVAVGTSLSALGIAFGMLVMTPRYLAVLGRMNALDSWLSVEDARGVPRWALAITISLVSVLVLVALGAATGEGLRRLFLLSSILVLTQYAVSVAALVGLALRGRAGLCWRNTWLAPFAALPLLMLAQTITLQELSVAAVVLAIGVIAIPARRTLFRDYPKTAASTPSPTNKVSEGYDETN